MRKKLAKTIDSRKYIISKKHKKKNANCLISCNYRFFFLWTSLGLNQGPPDYESVALTN